MQFPNYNVVYEFHEQMLLEKKEDKYRVGQKTRPFLELYKAYI